MPSKQKPDNGLDDSLQLKPLGKMSGKGKGWKKHLQSNGVKAGLAGVMVLLLVLIIGWQLMFGGSSAPKPAGTTASLEPSKTQSAPTPPPMPETTQAAPEQKDTPPADQNGQTAQESSPEQPAVTQPEATQPEQAQPVVSGRGGAHGAPVADSGVQSQLPEDVSKWEKGDYIRARQENNPKLLDAVKSLGEKNPGSVPVAQQLADLLKPPKPADPNNTAYTPSPMSGLTEATIDALGKNGSQAARQILVQILNGKFVTDNDQMAVDAVLQTLVQTPSPENDDILIKILVAPAETHTSSMRGASQPTDLRAKVLEKVKQNASENLCIKLAENLVQRGMEANDPKLEFLLQDNPANLAGQLVLYQSEDLSPEANAKLDQFFLDMKTKLEQSFLKYGSQAISLTMGIPAQTEGMSAPMTGTMPGDSSREKISDYDRGVQLAKLLWGEPLASLMSKRLEHVSTLEKSAPDIVLASTLPLDAIHAAMYKMLKKKAGGTEAPPQLLDAGWTDKDKMSDPSMIVLMKMLPRSRAMKNISLSDISGGTTTTGTGRTGRASTTMKPSVSDASSAYAATAEKEKNWIKLMGKMLGEWNTRFKAAALAQKRTARLQQKVLESPTRVDEFELPQDARVIAAYQLNWPEKAPPDLAKVKLGTLKIQYFQLMQENTFKKSLADMKKLTRWGETHVLPNGYWLETIKNGSQPNTKRSIDLFVTSSNSTPPQAAEFPQKEEPTDLQIDILAIEIADPATIKD
jgi:hypothetical protein